MKKLIIILLVLPIVLGSILTVTNFVFAQDQGEQKTRSVFQGCTGQSIGNDERECTPCDFINIFINASDIILGLSGTFAVIMFVYGGLVMITAYGNEARIKWGKEILIATVVGIFVIVLAWSTVHLIVTSLLNNPNSEWNVCQLQ